MIHHFSVAILLYNTDRNTLVFVRQFRPPIRLFSLLSQPNVTLDNLISAQKSVACHSGYSLELCAGIIDKPNLSTVEIAQEEIVEETGYNPPLK